MTIKLRLYTAAAGFMLAFFLSLPLSAEDAVYDPVLLAPHCYSAQSPCVAPEALLNGRDNIPGGSEPNQPNTLAASCPDGSAGVYHNSRSIDSVTLSTPSSGPFQAGGQIVVQAMVWCVDPNGTLRVFASPSASSPSWGYYGSVNCTGGNRVEPLTLTISPSFDPGTYAIRASFNYASDPIEICFQGSGLNDRDDVIIELDSDLDGLMDSEEIDFYLTDPLDSDSDGDGLTDGAEVNTHLTDPLDSDSDDDGLTDGAEVNIYLTNPLEADSDSDLMPDGWEVVNSLNPLADDAYLDADGDTLVNLGEFSTGTDPQDFDTDGDGLGDGEEFFIHATNPLLDDTDGDGLSDGEEVNTHLTDPLDSDSDDDGLADGSEVNTHLTDPLDADSEDDGMPDGWEVDNVCAGILPLAGDSLLDGDTDGLSNLDEFAAGTDPCRQDTDSDQLPDGWEVQFLGCGFDPLSYWSERLASAKLGDDLRLTSHQFGSIRSSLVFTGSEFGVSWMDYRYLNFEIYFARISGSGAKIGDDLRVTSNGSNSDNPSLVFTGSEFGVSWHDYRDGNSEIYFARISEAGAKIGADLRVTYDPNESLFPSLIFTGSEFGVSWQDHRDSDFEIFFVRISGDGNKIGGDIQVTNYSTEYQITPSLVFTGSEFGVSWQNYSDVYFSRLSGAGAKIGADIRVTSNAICSERAPLVFTGSEFGVSWQDYRHGSAEIYFSRFSGTGARIGDDIRVTYSEGHSESPSLVFTGSEFGVSWYDIRYGNSEIYFSRISGAGAKIGDDFRVTFNASSDYVPSLAFTGSDFGVSWEYAPPSTAEIYFSRFDDIGGYSDKDGDWFDESKEYLATTNPCSPDSDGDGLNDWLEFNVSCANELVPDSDSDGLQDGAEDANHNGGPDAGETNPCDADSDDDGLTDGMEVNMAGTDPLSADHDGDGLSDGEEVLIWGSNPVTADTDGDGLSDYLEAVTYNTNPWLIDSDGDGLADASEVWVNVTSPNDPDSDDDGILDGEEAGSPLTDNDGDNMPKSWEDRYDCVSSSAGDSTADPDFDGLTNIEEYDAGANPCAADTDEDGLTDAEEVNTTITDPASPDTDGDGLQDGGETVTDPLDADSDNDGYSDGAEISAGSNPNLDTSFPAPPQHLINYQGRLTDGSGLTITGPVSMTFSLFGALSGGTASWTETQTVTVTDGIYNVLLGSITPLDPSVFSTTLLYLEVTASGETLSPRSRITSVPYAIKAEELLGGRFEMDTRVLTIGAPLASVTVHVSFNRAFTSPPFVDVSPLAGKIGGVRFLPAQISGVTAEGFDVTFESSTGSAAAGSADFTYQAFGN